MRTELESRLVFAAPSELLVAAPVSAASQRLLGAYTAQVHPALLLQHPKDRPTKTDVHALLIAANMMLCVSASISALCGAGHLMGVHACPPGSWAALPDSPSPEILLCWGAGCPHRLLRPCRQAPLLSSLLRQLLAKSLADLLQSHVLTPGHATFCHAVVVSSRPSVTGAAVMR